MKDRTAARTPSFDARAVNETIQHALASAGLNTSSGLMRDVTETIQRALARSGMPPETRPASPASVIDVVGRVVDDEHRHDGAAPVQAPPGTSEPPGSFETHHYTNEAGTRAYKLYVPTGTSPRAPWPMVVMLHGCTQSADDFALGTQMNRLADANGFLVVYPEQSAHANPSRCWSWFNPQDQGRHAGEPSLIAGIVREVASRHDVDSRRIFVAGMSAGAAMALVLVETYPELFAGVGVHSGLPYGSAHDVPSAMLAMKGGRSGLPGLQGLQRGQGVDEGRSKRAEQAAPLIVFHGDRDHTVQPTNAAEIVRQARDAHLARPGVHVLQSQTQGGQAPGGRRYSRTVHVDGTGFARIESWLLHGAGHAWSGGDARGSYTDRAGPDASAEMVRFFLALPRAGSA